MKTWVKLYTEINRDPDMGTLSWAHRGIWQALLALCGELDHRDENEQETGQLDAIDRVAWSIRCDLPELQAAIQEFESRGMIEVGDDGILWLTNYPKRQKNYKEAKEAVRERVRRHRAKKTSPIFERDNWTCRYCGEKLNLEDCTIDHVVPVSKGGREDDDNLVTSCFTCNCSKGARTPEEAGMSILPLRNDAKGYVTTPDTDTDTESETESETEKIQTQNSFVADATKPGVAARSGSSGNGLTEGQRFWLSAFGAKRFANTVQREAVLALERDFGTGALKQGVEWAAKQGMAMGRAVTALETALPKWGKVKDDNVIRV